MKIEMGSKAKDRVTGFTGIVTGHAVYIGGGKQSLLTPPVGADGKLMDGQWFDEPRLEVVSGERVVGFDLAPVIHPEDK